MGLVLFYFLFSTSLVSLIPSTSPHPPSSPPPNVPHHITAKVPPKRRQAVESGGLARAAIVCSLAVWLLSLSVNQGLHTGAYVHMEPSRAAIPYR